MDGGDLLSRGDCWCGKGLKDGRRGPAQQRGLLVW